MEAPDHLPESDPTVLEYLKAVLRGKAPLLASNAPGVEPESTPEAAGGPEIKFLAFSLIIFLSAQLLIETFRSSLSMLPIAFFILALFLLIYSRKRGELNEVRFWRSSESQKESMEEEAFVFRWQWLLLAVATAILAFWIYKGGRHNLVSIALWLGSVVSAMGAFWIKPTNSNLEKVKAWFIKLITDKTKLVIVLLGIGLIIWFQFTRIADVPGEMVSSQVESFLSVGSILNGELALWFPRNLVSEPVGYYWAALMVRVFGLPFSYTGIKISYTLAGLIGVVYAYKLAKILFDRKTALIACLLLGAAYAPLIQQRAIVGFGLVIPIMAAGLYYLYEYLETGNENALLFNALLTSLGLMTNKVFLVLPLVNLLTAVVYQKVDQRWKLKSNWLLMTGKSMVVSIIVLLPMLLVVTANSEAWFSQIINGFTLPEGAESGFIVFLRNLIASLGVVNWTNRSSWVDGIPSRSGLDWVSAGLAAFGFYLMLLSTNKAHRQKLFAVLLTLMFFLTYGSLNLASPGEIPSLGKSLPVLFIFILLASRAFGLVHQKLSSMQVNNIRFWQISIPIVLAFLLVSSNYNLLVNIYGKQFDASAWNAREMAQVLGSFDQGSGGRSQGYVIGYPHWVDARAVAIHLEKPDKNISVTQAELQGTLSQSEPKIFLLNPFDKEGINQLQNLYPDGVLTTYQSVNPDKNFIIYIVGQ